LARILDALDEGRRRARQPAGLAVVGLAMTRYIVAVDPLASNEHTLISALRRHGRRGSPRNGRCRNSRRSDRGPRRIRDDPHDAPRNDNARLEDVRWSYIYIDDAAHYFA
jgi:hypothetical protein